MSNVAIDLTKTVKEIITTMKTAIDNLKGQVLQAVYPVGSVYVSITDSRDPADILGFGTWEALPAGYGLVAQGTATAEDGSTLTFTAGQKSGEFKHQITVGELNQYAIIWVKNTTSKSIECHGLDVGVTNTAKPNDWCRAPKNNAIRAGFDCGQEAIKMLGPHIAAYCWKRTA